VDFATRKSGKVTGTLAGSDVASLRLEQLEPCAGTYAGSAAIVEDGQTLARFLYRHGLQRTGRRSFIVVKH